MTRQVVWFSAGAASAVAAKMAVTDDPATVVAYCDTGSEHPDNARFLRDVEEWIETPIQILRSHRYRTVDEVIEGERYLAGPLGAPCTGILKREVRHRFQRPDDRQVFGYTAEESARIDRFREQNPEVDLVNPLMDEGLSKANTLAMIDRAGIEVPEMYRLGYQNNNCIGCVKGGMGYWNKVREDFPVVFTRRANQERIVGASICTEEYEEHGRRKKRPVYLDELEPGRGHYPTEIEAECSLLCAGVEMSMQALADHRGQPLARPSDPQETPNG